MLLSTDESLFGDTAGDPEGAAIADEEDSNKETDTRVQQGSDDAGEETCPPEDLKIVVSVKGGRATIGVQRTSSDPHIESFDDRDLSRVAQEVLAVTERARAKWEDEPRYPTHARPAPPARRRNRREQGSTQAGAAEGGADQQHSEPPRLF